jgi:hypothetical protein
MTSKKEHYKRTLLDLAGSNRFIPGIYNYCDRWCERCTMTSKCLSFTHEQEMKGNNDPEENDLNNERFWEQIRLSMEVTMEMLYEEAKKRGIDLDNLEDVVIPEHVVTPLEDMAKDYGHTMHNWLKNNYEIFTEKAGQIFLVKNEEEAKKFSDAWEVVQWYSFFIAAKVHRAHLDLEERQNGEDVYGVYSDNLGSAKIAIIAAERSMEALSVMYQELKESEDDILNFLAQLSKIKKQLLGTFPEVVDFKRPGFDD